MAKLDRNKLVLIKGETDEGSDAVPDGNDVMLVEEVTTTPEQESIAAPLVGASSSKEFSAPTRTRVSVSLKTRLRGSGEVPNTLGGVAPTKSPRIGRLLEASGMRQTNATILYFQTGLTVNLPVGTVIWGTHSCAAARLLVANKSGELYLIVESLNQEAFAANEPVVRDVVNTGTVIGTTAYTAGNGFAIYEAGLGWLYRPCTRPIQLMSLEAADPSTVGGGAGPQYGDGSHTDWKHRKTSSSGRFGSNVVLVTRGLTQIATKDTIITGETSGAKGRMTLDRAGEYLYLSATPVTPDPGIYLVGQTTGAVAKVLFWNDPVANVVKIRRTSLTEFDIGEAVRAESPLGTPWTGWTPNPTIVADGFGLVGWTHPDLVDVTGRFQVGERLLGTAEPTTTELRFQAGTVGGVIAAGATITGATSGATSTVLEKAKIGSTVVYVTRTNGTPYQVGENLTVTGPSSPPTFASQDVYRPTLLALSSTLWTTALTANLAAGTTITGATSGASGKVELACVTGEKEIVVLHLTAAYFAVGETITGTGSSPDPTVQGVTDGRTFRFPQDGFVVKGATSGAYGVVTTPRVGGRNVHFRRGSSQYSIPALEIAPELIATDNNNLYFELAGSKKFTAGEVLLDASTGEPIKRLAPAASRTIIKLKVATDHVIAANTAITGASSGATATLAEEAPNGATVLYVNRTNATAFANNENLNGAGATLPVTAQTGVVEVAQAAMTKSFFQKEPHTIYSYRGQRRTRAYGCRGNVKLDLVAGQVGMLTCDLEGTYVDDIDQSEIQNPDYGDSGAFLILRQWATYQEMPTANINLDVGNSLVDRDDVEAPEGLLSKDIGDRDPSLKVDPEATFVSQRNWVQIMRDAASGVAANSRYFDSNNALGSRFVLGAPNCQVVGVAPGERNSLATDQLDLRCRRSHVLGDDELYLLFF